MCPEAIGCSSVEWSDEVVEGTYPTQFRNERGEGLAGAHPEFCAYIDGLIAERHRDGDRPDDLVTRLMYTEVDGKRLTDVEVRTQLVFLIISGNETTRHLIANLIATVVSDPELFAELKADRSLVERAVEESLRIDSPVHVLLRNCEQATTMFGVEMQPGEKIAFGVASANRDESKYEDPHNFRLDRTNWREHFAFGGGPHICPGASLARLEARVALETFLDRVDDGRDRAGLDPAQDAGLLGERPRRPPRPRLLDAPPSIRSRSQTSAVVRRLTASSGVSRR